MTKKERREALFDAFTKASDACGHLVRAYAFGIIDIDRSDDRTICLEQAGTFLRLTQQAYDKALGKCVK